MALALTVRLARVIEVNDSPAGVALTGDSVAYDRGARLLLDHGPLQPRIFDQAPAYPLLVAATYAAIGGSGEGGSGENGPRALRLVQVLADVAALLALTIATRRRLGEAAALAVAALGALFGPMVFAVALVGKETFTGLALALFVLLAFGSRTAATHHQAGRWLAAGLALGSAMLLRENLLLLGLALPWLVAPSDKPGERRLAILSCGLGVALVLGAFAAWGLRATGEVTISSHQAGRNLLIGNLRGGNGLYRPLGGGSQDPEQEIADAAALAARILERETGRPVAAASLTSAQVSRTLAEEAAREVQADPWAWLRLMGRKVLLTLNSYEVPDTESLLLERATSPALQLARVGFALLLPLAAAGWLSQLSQHGASWFVQRLGLLSVGVLASIWPFFLLGRYRWPSAVFLLPLAGAGLVALVSAATPVGVRRRAVIAAAALCGVAFLPLVPREDRDRHEAVARFNRGGAAAALAAEPLDLALRTRSAASSEAAEAAAAWLIQARTDLDAALLLEPTMDAAGLARAAVRHRQGLLAWLAGDRAAASFCFETAAAEAASLTTSPLAQIREPAASLEATARQNLVRFGAATSPSPQSPEP